jgi:hypothetical protein
MQNVPEYTHHGSRAYLALVAAKDMPVRAIWFAIFAPISIVEIDA